MPRSATARPDMAHSDHGRLMLAGGLLYLVIIAAGISAEFAIRQPLIAPGEPEATAANILGATGLFRLGFALDSVMALADVALAVVLFLLFRQAQPVLATLAMVFRLVQAAILSGNLLLHHAALSLLEGPAGMGQAAPAALFLIEMQGAGYDLGLIFFGVNSLLMGALLLRSGTGPRALGAGLVAAGLVYLAGSYARFLAPALTPIIEPAYLVPLVAETGFALWLLTGGLRQARGTRPA